MFISLVKVTKANKKKLLLLKVKKYQQSYIDPINDTISIGTTKEDTVDHFLRAIKYKHHHVGIILITFNKMPYSHKSNNYRPGAHLVRLMIATNVPGMKQTQGIGIGTEVMKQILPYVKSKGYDTLYASYVPGPHNPFPFYKKIGFRHTGRKLWSGSEKEISYCLSNV